MEHFSWLMLWKHVALDHTFLLSGISGKNWISKGSEQVFMLLGFWDDPLITFTGNTFR